MFFVLIIVGKCKGFWDATLSSYLSVQARAKSFFTDHSRQEKNEPQR